MLKLELITVTKILHLDLLWTVFQIRDGYRVKNQTATATWTDTDKNDNKLKYCMTPCQKQLTGTLFERGTEGNSEMVY